MATDHSCQHRDIPWSLPSSIWQSLVTIMQPRRKGSLILVEPLCGVCRIGICAGSIWPSIGVCMMASHFDGANLSLRMRLLICISNHSSTMQRRPFESSKASWMAPCISCQNGSNPGTAAFATQGAASKPGSKASSSLTHMSNMVSKRLTQMVCLPA